MKYLHVHEECEACGGTGRTGKIEGKPGPGVGPCMECNSAGHVTKQVPLDELFNYPERVARVEERSAEYYRLHGGGTEAPDYLKADTPPRDAIAGSGPRRSLTL